MRMREEEVTTLFPSMLTIGTEQVVEVGDEVFPLYHHYGDLTIREGFDVDGGVVAVLLPPPVDGRVVGEVSMEGGNMTTGVVASVVGEVLGEEAVGEMPAGRTTYGVSRRRGKRRGRREEEGKGVRGAYVS